VSVLQEQQLDNDIESRLYDPADDKFVPHVAGWNDRVEYDDNGEELEENRRVVTIARFNEGRPTGRVWQWVGRGELEGWLYFEDIKGTHLRGSQVLFLYPDLTTGLRGEWTGEKIVHPKVVELVAERCRDGLKEVSTKGGEEEWGKDGSMDPQERKQVYVAKSGIAGGGQGLFARRKFLPGELISYFAGKKTVEEEFLYDNMTDWEEEDAASYYFDLAGSSPGWWGVPEGQVVDIPSDMRSITQFRTTLGHKTNAAFFDESNTDFDMVRHPVLGPIPCVIARRPIARGEELLVDYNYDLKTAAMWYRQDYLRALKAQKRKQKSLN